MHEMSLVPGTLPFTGKYVYAETQVRTSRMGRSGGDGEGGKRMCKSWSKLFPYAYAINLCVPSRPVIVDCVYLFVSLLLYILF